MSGAGGNDSSFNPSISANGRFIAFESEADNLSAKDNNRVENVFLRDRKSGATTLISRASGANGAGADDHSGHPSISANGRFVAFVSHADNLSAEDNDDVENVFLRDLQSGATTLVSRESGVSGAGGNGLSCNPSISANGRFVAFVSSANNLSAKDDNRVENIFLRDLQSGATTLVSRKSGANGAGADADSFEPAISADGRFVAFLSYADNLSAQDKNGSKNIFLRDLQSGATTLISRKSGANGAGAHGGSERPSISANGRFIAFASYGDNLSAKDNNGSMDIFLRDRKSGATTLVSRESGVSGAGADGGSESPSISANGRFIAFESEADNLSAKDNSNVINIFLRSLATSGTAR